MDHDMPEYLDADGDPLHFAPGTPEEAKQAVAAQHARQRQIRADIERRLRALATEGTQEQIEAMRFVLHQCAQYPQMTKFYEGIFATAAVIRFGVGGLTIDPTLIGKVGTPGVDDAFADFPVPVVATTEPHPQPTPPSPEPAGEQPPPAVHPGLLAAQGDVGDDEVPLPTVPDDASALDVSDATMMARYRVRSTGDGEQVECIDCGLKYVSLQDRMVKAPDDCHGCHDKARWG